MFVGNYSIFGVLISSNSNGVNIVVGVVGNVEGII
jgi:hypothetical protein